MTLHTELDALGSARRLNLQFNNSTMLTSCLLLQPGPAGSLMTTVRKDGRMPCSICKLQQSCVFSLRCECWRRLRGALDKQNDQDHKVRVSSVEITSEMFFKEPRGSFRRILQMLLSAVRGSRRRAAHCAQQSPTQ